MPGMLSAAPPSLARATQSASCVFIWAKTLCRSAIAVRSFDASLVCLASSMRALTTSIVRVTPAELCAHMAAPAPDAIPAI